MANRALADWWSPGDPQGQGVSPAPGLGFPRGRKAGATVGGATRRGWVWGLAVLSPGAGKGLQPSLPARQSVREARMGLYLQGAFSGFLDYLGAGIG